MANENLPNNDEILSAMAVIARVVSQPENVRIARETEYRAARARLDALILDGRVEELPDGRLRYHLETSITMGETGAAIEFLTFKRPTVGTVRASSGFQGDERVAYLIKSLAGEIPDDKTLNKIDGSEWDDIAEVCLFPFEFRPPRVGAGPVESPIDSGET